MLRFAGQTAVRAVLIATGITGGAVAIHKTTQSDSSSQSGGQIRSTTTTDNK